MVYSLAYNEDRHVLHTTTTLQKVSFLGVFYKLLTRFP